MLLRRALAPALFALGLLALLVAFELQHGAPGAAALTNCDTTEDGINPAEQQMLDLINAARASVQLDPLKFSPNLNRAAAWMSADMVTRGYQITSHNDSLGRTWDQRLRDCGYPSGSAGENIAWISSDATATFNAWMQSAGHRANINGTNLDGTINQTYYNLVKREKVIGIGQVGRAWTTDFGTVDDSGAAATPPTTTAANTPTPTKTPSPSPSPTPTRTPSPSAGIVMPLSAGLNLVTYAGPTQSAADALYSLGPTVRAAYRWDAATGHWQKFAPGAPAYVNSFTTFTTGSVYYLELSAPQTWQY